MRKQSIKGAAKRAVAKDAAARKQLQKKKTADSFQNFAAGMGIGTDNISSGASYGFNPISRIRTELEWIHRGSWLGGVAIDVVADDMTRAGITIKGDLDPEDMQKLNERATTLRIWQQINEVVKWSRLYGGCIGVMMIDGQKTETPLNIERVGKDQFKGVLVLDRWMVQPSLEDLVTEMGPDLGMPKYYDVVADAPALRRMKIHYSRCFRLDGVRLPYWQRLQENLWGISVLERLYDRMVAFDSATQGAAQLVYKSYIRTYKIDGFREVLMTGGKALQALMQSVQMMRSMQSNEGITLLDMKDDFAANTGATAFGGLSDALLQFGQQLAGALQIPLVRLFGQSPAGLSATGESDLRTYYDGIKQQQENTLRVPVTNIYRMLAQSLGMTLGDGFQIEFNSLWQLTPQEKVEMAAQLTTAIVQAEESGVIGRGTALKELKQSSEKTEVYTNIDDKEIEDADAELPPSVQEALGAAQSGEAPPESATDMILGPDPAAQGAQGGEATPGQGAGKKPAAKDGATRTTDGLVSELAGVKGGSGGPHAKWEETKHSRAGKGQTIGKSKGGQFTAKAGAGGGSKSGGKAEEVKNEPVQTAQLRRQFRQLENQMLQKHPDWKPERIAAELIKTQEVPRTGGRPQAGGLRRKAGELGAGRGQGTPETPAEPINNGKQLAAAYLGGKGVTQLANEVGMAREVVRDMLRAAGVYKEFGGNAPHGHQMFVPKDGKGFRQRLGGQQTHIRRWFQENPNGGSWQQIAEAIEAGGKFKAGAQSAAKVVKHYLNEWFKKGWLDKPGAAPAAPKAAKPVAMPVAAEEIEKFLSSSPIKAAKPIGMGITRPYKLTFADGSNAVYKPRGRFQANDMERELGAWEVAKVIGMQDMMNPVVLRKDVQMPPGFRDVPKEGVVVAWTKGQMANKFNDNQMYDGARDRNRAAVFDYVVANSDRHAGNWMIENGNHIRLIDHGAAFPDAGVWGGVRNISFISKARNSGDDMTEFIKPYIENKAAILGALKKAGVPQGAINRTGERIDALKTDGFDGAVQKATGERRVEKKAEAPKPEAKPAREPQNAVEQQIWELHKNGLLANQIAAKVGKPAEEVRKIRKELRGW